MCPSFCSPNLPLNGIHSSKNIPSNKESGSGYLTNATISSSINDFFNRNLISFKIKLRVTNILNIYLVKNFN